MMRWNAEVLPVVDSVVEVPVVALLAAPPVTAVEVGPEEA